MSFMRHQPQGRVVIDWSNPITQGLVDVFIPNGAVLLNMGKGRAVAMDAVNGAAIEPHGAGLAATYSASAYHRRTSAPDFDLAEVTLLAVCTPADTAAAATAVIAYGSSVSNNPLLLMGQGTGGSAVNFRVRGGSSTPDQEAAGPVAPSIWSSGKSAVLVGIRSANLGRQTIYCGGQQVNSIPYTSMSNPVFNRSAVGALLRSSTSFNWSGNVSLGLAFNRALSDEEVRSLTVNPWQIFAAPEDAYEAAAESNSYLLTVSGALLAAAGGNVAMRVSRRLRADPASLVIAPGPLGMRASRKLTVAPAALTLATSGVALRASRRLSVTPAAMAMTGRQVSMLYAPNPALGSYTLPVSAAAMTLTGGNVGMRVTRRLRVEPASLVLAGGAVRVLVGRRLMVSPAGLQLAGGSVTLRFSAKGEPFDITKIHPSRLVIFEGSGSRITPFEGSGSRITPFEGSGSRITRFE